MKDQDHKPPIGGLTQKAGPEPNEVRGGKRNRRLKRRPRVTRRGELAREAGWLPVIKGGPVTVGSRKQSPETRKGAFRVADPSLRIGRQARTRSASREAVHTAISGRAGVPLPAHRDAAPAPRCGALYALRALSNHHNRPSVETTCAAQGRRNRPGRKAGVAVSQSPQWGD